MRNYRLTAETRDGVAVYVVSCPEDPEAWGPYEFTDPVKAGECLADMREYETKKDAENRAKEARGLDERKLAVLAMEYLARNLNDEDILEGWLMGGVADGDIPFGAMSPAGLDLEYYTDPENFADLVACFLRCMSRARMSGGLWCGGVVGGEMDEADKLENATRKAWAILGWLDQYVDELGRGHLFGTPEENVERVRSQASDHMARVDTLPDDLKAYALEILGKVCDLVKGGEAT